jgi:hypothetical protein
VYPSPSSIQVALCISNVYESSYKFIGTSSKMVVRLLGGMVIMEEVDPINVPP